MKFKMINHSISVATQTVITYKTQYVILLFYSFLSHLKAHTRVWLYFKCLSKTLTS